MNFQLSQDARLNAIRIGKEQSTVLVIDNALAAPEAAVDDAAGRKFSPIGPYYPGVRAALDSEFFASQIDALRDYLEEYFGVAGDRWLGECFYSIVTTPPSQLTPIQRMPHFDGVEEKRLAALLYLNQSRFGGTSFYRQRATGFESVNAERFERYRKTLESEVREGGLPPPRYIEDGAPFFERVETIDAQFNRMLIYNGNLLHCSAIDNNSALPADPKSGRLTLNTFLRPVE